MLHSKNLLLIFIKNPQKGKVKTRLAESIGDETALQVYRQLLILTKSVTDQLSCSREVWYSRFINDDDLWPDDSYEKKLQKGEGLGERMKNAFQKAFEKSYKKVVIIGSDCPELTPRLIEQAYEMLNDYDLVVGPSEDGGYYLLGMNAFHQELFSGKAWSTSSVLNQTLEQAKALELSYKQLHELNDIDTKEDLDEFQDFFNVSSI